MSALPAELSTGMVHGRFIVAMIDGDDTDQEPEAIPASGKIVFKASVPYVPVPVTSEGPVTVLKGPITGVLDSDGYLCTPHPVTSEPMYRGVKLLATDDPDMAVTDWTWTAEYRLDPVGAVTLAIAAHAFALPSGSELDLTTLVKVPSSPGYGLPQAEAAVLRAEAAAQVALDVKAMADAGEFDGAQGLPGNATMRVDTTVGTRVFITDGVTEHLLKAETGMRRGLSSFFRNGVTAVDGDTSRITRSGDSVTLYLSITLPSGWVSGTTGFELPAGFRPPINFYMPPSYGGAGSGNVLLIQNGSGNIYSTSGTFRYLWTYTTKDPWPTILPGTPA